MRELKAANHLLGENEGLAEAFNEDGYLFFRGVLDAKAVARLRGVYLDTLREIGVVDPQSDEPVWNGAPLDNFVERMKALTVKEPWKVFRDDPEVARFLHESIGEDYIWLPLIVYRVTPPSPIVPADSNRRSRFKRVHQDGHFNPGLEFKVCWAPLVDIDEQVGGIAVAEGWHKKGYLHDTSAPAPMMFEISKSAIPDDAWVRTNFEPGDLLVLHAATPHTGITNQSNRFRLSMDFRLSARSGDLLIIGNVLSIDRDHISICTEDRKTIELDIDDETYCPARQGIALLHRGRVPRAELSNYVAVGQGVIATSKSGKAGLIRGFDIVHRE
jgi:hypothetical protein